MICPNCKKETPSILRTCENCKTDLEQYRAARNKEIEGTGEPDLGPGFRFESLLLSLGPIGGIIIMALSVLWFYGGLKANRIFFYPPILFIIGVVGFLGGLKKKR